VSKIPRNEKLPRWHALKAAEQRLISAALPASRANGAIPIRTHIRRPTGPPLRYFAAVSCCSICSNLASDLGGAKEIRTPDLLHAIWRQHVYPRPSRQVTVPTRPRATTSVRVRCGTFLLYRFPSLPEAPAVAREDGLTSGNPLHQATAAGFLAHRRSD